jgi:hypothetical protein
MSQASDWFEVAGESKEAEKLNEKIVENLPGGHKAGTQAVGAD